MFVIVWKFQAKKEFQNEFENAYGPHGVWVEFFSRTNDYLGSSLLKDFESKDLYLVMDRWETKEAYHNFMQRFGDEYNLIDKHFREITNHELKVGEYLVY